MSSNVFTDAGLIFFITWSFMLTKLSIAAFGRELLPWRAKSASVRPRRNSNI